MSTLQQIVRDEFVRYFRHLAGRVEKAVRSVPQDKIWVKPFAFGNSLGHLLLHLTGNLSHYIGAGIAGTGYVRNRPLEFTDPKPPPIDEALTRFNHAVEMVVQTIQNLDETEWAGRVPDPDKQAMYPVETRFGMFLVCAAHLNNHIGQMSYLVQAHGHSTQEPPVW